MVRRAGAVAMSPSQMRRDDDEVAAGPAAAAPSDANKAEPGGEARHRLDEAHSVVAASPHRAPCATAAAALPSRSGSSSNSRNGEGVAQRSAAGSDDGSSVDGAPSVLSTSIGAQ